MIAITGTAPPVEPAAPAAVLSAVALLPASPPFAHAAVASNAASAHPVRVRPGRRWILP
jgi:hypothetical protein